MPESTPPDTIECLVVGGIADGVYLRGLRADADIIQLSRPTHLKPLATPDQKQPEAAKETEDYQVRTFLLDGPQNTDFVIGIAMPVGKSLAETFSLLVTKYLQQSVIDEQATNQPVTLRKFDA